MTGRLYGVGVGPGDPELLTLKAVRILGSVPVIAWPAPETGPSLARAIAASHLKDGQTEVAIRMPMAVERFPAQAVYDKAANDLGEYLHQGQDVAVLCEGDPFLYGSFQFLFARMAERWPVTIIPGVSSLTACPAVARLPLMARNDVLVVLPAPLPADRLRARLAEADAAAIFKVGRHLGKVTGVLADLGLLRDAVYVERATLETQRVLPLADLREIEAPYFSMVLVHRRGAAFR